MKLLGIISVCFDVTDQLLYNILTEFGAPVIKICLNETYSLNIYLRVFLSKMV
jgi:hypothetical protein